MFGQLGKGYDEPILEPGRVIIDAQHHLFIRQHFRYLCDEYLNDVRAGHNIAASVYVETQAFSRPDGPTGLRALGEVEFANGVGAIAASGLMGRARICAAIVAHADLRDELLPVYLTQAAELAPLRLRGVRQSAVYHPDASVRQRLPVQAPEHLLSDPAFRAGFRMLTEHNMSFDAGVFLPQLPQLAQLADDFPDVTIIINNGAPAPGAGCRTPDARHIFKEWQAAIRDIALRPNVMCKICGLGLPFWGFGFENRKDNVTFQELSAAWSPYVETLIEAFGADRCMMGSDYPPDASSAGYVPLWNALKDITRHASESEKDALFRASAARIYRIPRLLLQDC